jgi:hypothetical protein
MIRLLAHPLTLAAPLSIYKPDQQHAERLRKRDKSYDLKKAWSSINQFILSGFVHCYNRQ